MAIERSSRRAKTLRGGKRERISHSRFVELASGHKNPPFLVEEILVPKLGENSWGGFVIRHGATRKITSSKR